MCLKSWGTVIEEEIEANKEANIKNTIEETEFTY